MFTFVKLEKWTRKIASFQFLRSASSLARDNALKLKTNEIAETIECNTESICNSMNVHMINKAAFRILLPGFHYCDFNRLGKPAVWSLFKYMEHNRPLGLQEANHNNLYGMTLRMTGVASHQTYSFTPELHRHIKIGSPLLFTNALGFMTEKQYSYHGVLWDIQSGEILVENNRLLLLLDRETGRPKQIPKELRETFSPFATTGRITVAAPPVFDEHNTFSWSTVAVHSDTDLIYHINQSVYSRYCIDCATVATSEGFYEQLHGDFMRYDIADMQCSYLRELFPGDDINVRTWQSDDNRKVLYFVIEKNNEPKPVFKCVMTLL